MFENKLVAILNKEIDQGVAMNALAHMSLGLGGDKDKVNLRLDTYTDANGNVYPNISQIPFIVLRGKSNEIRKLVDCARTNGMRHTVFLNTMTGGGYQEQIERTSHTNESDLTYYGCALFGSWDKVSELTKRFSLWK